MDDAGVLRDRSRVLGIQHFVRRPECLELRTKSDALRPICWVKSALVALWALVQQPSTEIKMNVTIALVSSKAHRWHSHPYCAAHAELYRCHLPHHHRTARSLRREHPAFEVTDSVTCGGIRLGLVLAYVSVRPRAASEKRRPNCPEAAVRQWRDGLHNGLIERHKRVPWAHVTHETRWGAR